MKIWSAFTWPKTPKARLFLAIFGFFILISIVLIILVNSSEPTKKPIKLADIIKQNPNLAKDDDKDGLKNWEEQIYQTDPKNPDTDGDGTNDGDEINQGRDPNKKGPNDKIEPSAISDGTNIKNGNLTEDFTDKFVKIPVAQIISGEKPKINQELIESYADQLTRGSVLDKAPQITDLEIKKNPVNSVQNINDYMKSFEKIWNENIAVLKEKELDVAVTAFQEQNFSNLSKIDANIAAYQKTIDEIKKLSPPDALYTFHKKIINFLYQIKLSAELMQNAENDPIKAMLAIKDRLDLNNKLNAFLQDFQKKIVEKIKNAKVVKKP